MIQPRGLTPAQFFVVRRLYELGRGRMTRWLNVRCDPRTCRVLLREHWVQIDGDRIGLTEEGWQQCVASWGATT